MTARRGAPVPALRGLAALAAVAWAVACARGEEPVSDADPRAARRAAEPAALEAAVPRIEGVVATPEDWRIVVGTVRWARARGLDTVAVGDAVAAIGVSFVGTPYVPKTLEVPGPERTVVNLGGLDCVTFVESVLALAHVARRPDVAADDPEAVARAYAEALTRIRYRGGVRDGYGSRLHYFSEWIRDGAAKGLLRPVTPALPGAVEDREPLTFMSEHPDAYPQLSDPSAREAIRAVEERLSRAPRSYLPQERIDGASSGIRTGDVVAATSTVPGLDVAHTGIALRRDGALRLLHAPLVGDSVQVSTRPLARRIAAQGGQDGIMVARPLDGPAPARPPGSTD